MIPLHRSVCGFDEVEIVIGLNDHFEGSESDS
ncbi:unnamed protein product, partial [marine sediment metagenome]